MRVLFAASTITIALMGAAAAESFTRIATLEPTTIKTVTVGTHTATLTSFKGTYVHKWASGTAETTGTVACTSWSNPPGSPFHTSGICEDVDSDGGKGSYIHSCNFLNEAKTETECWGVQSGKGGKIDGRTGTITWKIKDNKGAAAGIYSD